MILRKDRAVPRLRESKPSRLGARPANRAAILSLGIFGSVVLLVLAAPAGAEAHGLILNRQDLPIPEWLFAWAASLVLIVSFVALTLAWRTPRFEDDRWRPVPWLSRLLVNPATRIAAGAIGVALLGVVVWSGLVGTDAPDKNFSVTFVFVTFWLGLVVLSMFFGDVFRAFNPWRAIARAAGAGFRLVSGQSAPVPMRYPSWLGRWPAVAGIVGFLWFELIYASGFQTVGLDPYSVAVATLVYSLYTLAAMALFGVDEWLERGEAFSVYYNMLSQVSPVEVRDGVLGVRRALAGTTTWVTHPGSLPLILVTIGGAAFDGAQEGVLKAPIAEVFNLLREPIGQLAAYRVSQTLFLFIVLLLVAGLFWAGIRGMHSVRGSLPTRELGRRFGHSFIPIAIAYLIAHYFSLAVFLEQAQFTFLLSDPLGEGSDFFGTLDGGIDYGLIGTTTVWYVQVGALVVGHVTALVLGHDRAIATYGDPRRAARSQYWMLALMVGFTCLGLLLLSQANA